LSSISSFLGRWSGVDRVVRQRFDAVPFIRPLDRADADGPREYGFSVHYFLNLFYSFFFFFWKIRTFPRAPSRAPATRTRREFLFRNSYPRYASVGVPASNTSLGCPIAFAFPSRPRFQLARSRRYGARHCFRLHLRPGCVFLCSHCFWFLGTSLIELGGHNGLMRKSGC